MTSHCKEFQALKLYVCNKLCAKNRTAKQNLSYSKYCLAKPDLRYSVFVVAKLEAKKAVVQTGSTWKDIESLSQTQRVDSTKGYTKS